MCIYIYNIYEIQHIYIYAIFLQKLFRLIQMIMYMYTHTYTYTSVLVEQLWQI